ncbi:unnamed protein product [Mucor fragilis]
MLNLSIDRPSAMSKAQKDVLADASNSTSSAADAATSTGATMSATAPMSASVSTYPSTLSGGSTIMVTSTMSTKPTSSLAGGKSTGSSTPKTTWTTPTRVDPASRLSLAGLSLWLASLVPLRGWLKFKIGDIPPARIVHPIL